MAAVTYDVVGREVELAALGAFLDGKEEGPAALLLEGEAGIGKTTLWRAGIRDAESRAHAVLVARPAGAEGLISFAALGDLMEEVGADALAALPGPQRRALEVALALADAEGPAPDPHAIAMAFLNVLRSLAAERPVLLALDDIQWLDRPSADVVAYAVRRLRDQPVRILATLRVEPRAHLPLELDRALPEDRLRRLEVGPLSLGALHHLVTTRLGVALARPTLRRLQEASGGNPFYALEIARALRSRGDRAELGKEIPLPENLLELVRARLALPRKTQQALLAVALLADPTGPVIERVVGAPAPLEPAFEAQVVELHGERVRFTHPLLASAVIASAPAARQRLLHRRLAEVVEDAEERAWHGALGAEGRDEPVAALVEAAARDANQRGAPGRAAELAERASGLTPEADPESGWRRSLLAGEYHLKSGDIERARVVLGPLTDMIPPGSLRARVLSALADCYEDSFEAATDFLSRARAEAGDDAALLAEVVWKQAILSWAIGSFDGAAARFSSAVELAEEATEDDLLVLALSGSVHAHFYMGRHDRGRLARALAIDEALGGCRIAWGPGLIKGFVLLFEGHLGEARRELEGLLLRADEEGDEYARVMILQLLSHLEWCAGQPEEAAALAEEALAGVDPTHYASLHRKARAEATLGDVATARLDAENALELAEQAKDAIHAAHARGVLVFVELSSGDPDAAHRRCDDLPDRLTAMGLGEPAIFPFFPDEIEALIALGQLERAEALLGWLEERGRSLGRTWAIATGARCRGLLASARGDHDSALAAFDEALAHHERLPFPLERGRTLLALGQVRRRAKQKRAARESLGEALAIFEELRASLWAEKARTELARIGGRAPSTGELTPTERRIAGLVAEGQSNKEVAAALFVTVKTVERNLTRIYEKLGIRSRAELARRYAREERTNSS